MDKRILRKYISKLPNAILHNGNERYVVATEHLDDLLVIKIFFKKTMSSLSRAYSLGWVHFYSEKEKDYITYDLTGTFKTCWLKKKLGEVTIDYFIKDFYEIDAQGIVLKIHNKEREILAVRLKKRYEVEINKFKKFNKQVRKIPKKFFEWINKDLIPGFGLYDNKKKIAKCTKCETCFRLDKGVRGVSITCPECGKKLKALPIGRYRVNLTGYCAFAQKCNYGLVIRYFEWTYRMRSSAGIAKNVFEYRRDYLNENDEVKSYIFHTYKHSEYTGFIPAECYNGGMAYIWHNEPFLAFTTSADFWYECKRYLKKSYFKYHILDSQYRSYKYNEFVTSDVTYYFNVFGKYPALETLFKNKQYGIIKAALMGYSRIKENEVVPAKALGLNRNLIAKLSNIDNPNVLEAVQYLYKEKQNVTDEIINFLCRQSIRIGDLDKLIKYNFQKIIRYINNQGSPNRIIEYIDYLDCCRMLGMDMTRNMLYPQNLLVAHNEAVTKINVEKNKIKDEQYKELLKNHLNKYQEMEVKDFIIRLPKNIGEIIYEGLVQHNCVGNIYIDRILSRRSNILFVRKKESPDEPFVTLEVFNDRIVQCRYKYNKMCGPEITDIVEEYLSMINEKDCAA